jgi:hypothetical protein
MLAVTQMVKHFSVFMEFNGLSLCSQKPMTGTYPEPDDPIHIFIAYFSKINFNIIPKWMPPMKFSNQNL